MDYRGNLIRPPSEANSIILQVTLGCSYNKCTFCGAYKDALFTLKPPETINEDIAFASKYCTHQSRLFLADGDVLILKQSYLADLIKNIRRNIPKVKRISLYGSSRALNRKSNSELSELKSLGLDRIYMGLESGCNEVLKTVNKGATAESMIMAAGKAQKAGIFLSVSVLLGLGGSLLSEQNAILTARALNKMAPQQIAALTLIPLDNTPLGRDVRNGDFKMIGPKAILQELYTLVSYLTVSRSQFHANHASNYLHLSGRLSKDKARLLAEISSAMSGNTKIVPENLRAL